MGSESSHRNDFPALSGKGGGSRTGSLLPSAGFRLVTIYDGFLQLSHEGLRSHRAR